MKATLISSKHYQTTSISILDPDLFDWRVVVRHCEFHAEAFQANVISKSFISNDVICADHHGWLRPASIKYS
eukprot:scaffold11074_cov111-Skeletonema_menzelii.AAC.3